MMIEFKCENLVYNPLLGHNVACNHRIIVPDSKVGEMITCPKCKEEIEVPFEQPLKSNSAANPVRVDPAPTSKTPASEKKTTARGGTGRPAKSKPADVAKKTVRRKENQPASEIQLSALQPRPKSDLSTISFDDESARKPPMLAKDKSKRCKKCGERVDAKGRCSVCGFAEPKFEKATQPLSQIKVGLAGFQLWFVQTMSESIPFKYLEWGAHLSIASIVCMMSVAAIFGVGGFAGIGLVILLLGFASLYALLVLKGHRLARDPQARLSWYQRPLWYAVLLIARRMNWQGYDERFKDRKIIDERGAGLTDDHIQDLEGLALCEVLDLERTLISDKGLRKLYGLENLHCVVVRKTGVTHEGVFRLQQTRPNLWIWF